MKDPKDTGTETGRNDDTEIDADTKIESETHAENRDETASDSESAETAEPYAPTEDWIKKYQKQATPKLITDLNRFARTRALAVADVGGRKVDDYYARELVLDALGDTWLGIVRWDPDKCSLGYHLWRTINGRSDKHRKHAEDHPHDSLGDRTDDSRFAESDASELLSDHERPIKRVYASGVLARIRELAARDKPLLRILDAYDAGAENKEDVLAYTKMKERTYKNAYTRMRRIVRHLTDHKLAPKKRA